MSSGNKTNLLNFNDQISDHYLKLIEDIEEEMLNISSGSISYKPKKKNNPRYYAKRSADLLYDLIGEFEQDLDDDFIEEVEELIMEINAL